MDGLWGSNLPVDVLQQANRRISASTWEQKSTGSIGRRWCFECFSGSADTLSFPQLSWICSAAWSTPIGKCSWISCASTPRETTPMSFPRIFELAISATIRTRPPEFKGSRGIAWRSIWRYRSKLPNALCNIPLKLFPQHLEKFIPTRFLA